MFTTRNDYLHLHPSLAAAIEFEAAALSVGDALPACAQAVRDGDEEPTSEYWAWLCSQVEDCDAS